MKRKIKTKCNQRRSVYTFVLLGFLFWGGTLSAQDNSENQKSGMTDINFGGKVGTTINHFTHQQPHVNVSQGITAGVFMRYGFSSRFGLQIEGNYAWQGGRLISFDLPAFYGYENWYHLKAENRNIRMHNLEIPLLMHYSMNLEGGRFKLNLGPAFSYNLHSGMKKEVTVFSEADRFNTYTGEENITSNINSFDVAAIGGIGFELDVSSDMFLIFEGRYKYGFLPVYEGYSYVGLPQIQGDLQNHSMSFSVGVGF